MIYTKEPANKVFVFVTAYRGHESQEVNEKMLKEVSLGGTLQRVDAPKGECYSVINGQYWEVV